MAPPLIQLKDITLTFGGTPLLSGVELTVSPAERVCLIGRNGSGKSTLLKIAAGTVEPDSGSRFVQPGATIRYLPQEPDFAGFATTLSYVEQGLGPGDDRTQGDGDDVEQQVSASPTHARVLQEAEVVGEIDRGSGNRRRHRFPP